MLDIILNKSQKRETKKVMQYKIRQTEEFDAAIDELIEYISKNKPLAALNFLEQVESSVNSLKENPLICRKSIYADTEQNRDLIIKGYTVVFKIYGDENEIVVLMIFKDKNPKTIKKKIKNV